MAGRIITMALESVDYSEEKACKILEIVMQDDKDTAAAKDGIQKDIKGDATVDSEKAAPTTANPPTDLNHESPDAVDHEKK